LTPARGEIWLVDFGDPIGTEQSGRRPAVVISADRRNRSRAGIVIVIPCTTRRRELASHVELDPTTSGLDDVTYAKCEDIKSVSDERLGSRLGHAPLDAMFHITRSLRILIDA